MADRAVVLVEKAVDVMIAVDMVVMAERDAFDTAFLRVDPRWLRDCYRESSPG